jgi:hypothetical protein
MIHCIEQRNEDERVRYEGFAMSLPVVRYIVEGFAMSGASDTDWDIFYPHVHANSTYHIEERRRGGGVHSQLKLLNEEVLWTLGSNPIEPTKLEPH